MEEYIKTVEEMVEVYYDCAVIDEDGFDMRVDIGFMKKDAQALENLIKGYRELEEENKNKNKIIGNIRAEFLKYNWETSNNVQMCNQLKSLYESIFLKPMEGK